MQLKFYVRLYWSLRPLVKSNFSSQVLVFFWSYSRLVIRTQYLLSLIPYIIVAYSVIFWSVEVECFLDLDITINSCFSVQFTRTQTLSITPNGITDFYLYRLINECSRWIVWTWEILWTIYSVRLLLKSWLVVQNLRIALIKMFISSKLFVLQNPTCAQHNDDRIFSILAQCCSPFIYLLLKPLLSKLLTPLSADKTNSCTA